MISYLITTVLLLLKATNSEPTKPIPEYLNSLPKDDTIGTFYSQNYSSNDLKIFNHLKFKSHNLTSWNREEKDYAIIEKLVEKELTKSGILGKEEEATSTKTKICKKSSCGCAIKQIKKDFSPWSNSTTGISQEMYFKMNKIPHISKYKIRKNILYRDDKCFFPARCEGIEHFILKLLKRKVLPDMDVFINVKDWPQTKNFKYGRREDLLEKNLLPILSFSKVPSENFDILYPAWTFWAGGPAVWPLYPTGLGRWDQYKTELDKVQQKSFPWEKKLTKAFFRGSRTSQERDPLVLLSRSRPDMIDAAYTSNQAFKSKAKDTLYAEPVEAISLKDHCQYKYLFNYRGVAASFRHKHLFMCKSLVFHVGPKNLKDSWIEFYYHKLKPWYHYIPIGKDTPVDETNMKDLRHVIDYFMRNDKIAEKIAENGYDMVNEVLTFENIECYWEMLLKEYSRLSKFDLVKVPDSFIRIGPVNDEL